MQGGEGGQHQVGGPGLDGQRPRVRMVHGDGPGRFRQGADDPFEAEPCLVDRLRVQMLAVEIAQHHERRHEALRRAGGRFAPQRDEDGFQGGALRRPPALCEEERAMGQADRIEESLAQLVEQRRSPGRVQVDQPVDPREGHRRGVEVAPAGRQLQPRRLDQRRPAAGEGVEYDPVARGVGGQQLFDELRRELSGPGQGVGPHPLGDVEGALGKGGPVQGRGGEGVVQGHGRNEWDAERGRGGEALPARRCLSLMFGSSYSDGGEAEHA